MEADRLAALTDQQKQVLRLHYDGLTAKEIARALSITERAVYQRLDRARRVTGVERTAQAAQMFAVLEGRRPPSETTYQPANVAGDEPAPQSGLRKLLIPEASGSRLNDLTIPQRALVIAIRALLIVLALVALASLMLEVGRLGELLA